MDKNEDNRFQKLMKDFEKSMKKHGFNGYTAVELDANRVVHGPYFGWEPDTDKLLVGFSSSGENACPCCIANDCEEGYSHE